MLDDVNGKTILDIGCGTGRYAVKLAAAGAKVTAIDFCDSMISVAKQKKYAMKIDFICCSIENIPLQEKFDIVLCNLLLNHIENLNGPLFEISRLVKSNGYVIISDLRTDFYINKSRCFRMFGKYATDSYRHTQKDYNDAFRKNKMMLSEHHDLVFTRNMVKKYRRYFYLVGSTIGYVFKLVKMNR